MRFVQLVLIKLLASALRCLPQIPLSLGGVLQITRYFGRPLRIISWQVSPIILGLIKDTYIFLNKYPHSVSLHLPARLHRAHTRP